jgi:hypothetical protein
MIADWADTSTDTWVNHRLTHGIVLDEWRGATWPSHGLPRGTLWLAFGLCKIWGLHRSRTPDLLQATDWQDRDNHPLHWCFLITIWQMLYLCLVKRLVGGGKGWGFAPAHGLVNCIRPQELVDRDQPLDLGRIPQDQEPSTKRGTICVEVWGLALFLWGFDPIHRQRTGS